MVTRCGILALAATFGVICFAGVVYSGQPRPTHRNKSGAQRGQVGLDVSQKFAAPGLGLSAPAPTQIRESSLTFSVSPSIRAAGDALKLQASVAGLITRANITPAHRLRHFHWLGDSRFFRVTGWGGFVEEVERTPVGYIATVRVSPVFTVNGSSATSGDYTIEKYLLSDGQVQFVEGIDPPDASPSDLVTD